MVTCLAAWIMDNFNPLNSELNPISHLLALLGAHPILHISRIRVIYIYIWWLVSLHGSWIILHKLMIFNMSIWKSTPCTFHGKRNSTTKCNFATSTKRTKISTTISFRFHSPIVRRSHGGLWLWLVGPTSLRRELSSFGWRKVKGQRCDDKRQSKTQADGEIGYQICCHTIRRIFHMQCPWGNVFFFISEEIQNTLNCILFLNINQHDALNFIIRLFQASTCFEHMCSSSGGQNCIIQSLVSSYL